MKNKIIYPVITYFAAMIGASLISLGTCSLVIRIVDLFIVVDYFIAAIIRAVVSAMTVGGVVGAVSAYDSYKKACFSPASTVAAYASAAAVRLVLSLLLAFYPFVAGGTLYLAGLIGFGSSFVAERLVADIYLWQYILAHVIYFVFELGTVLLCGAFGKRHRLNIREELYSHSDNS